jgi:hypothetical protein
VKTPASKVRRNGGSSVVAAVGRSALWAKNMPPTQTVKPRMCKNFAMIMGFFSSSGKRNP